MAYKSSVGDSVVRIKEVGGKVEVIDDLTSTVAGKEPGYETNCLDDLGVLGEEVCEGNTAGLVTNEPGSTPPSVLGVPMQQYPLQGTATKRV